MKHLTRALCILLTLSICFSIFAENRNGLSFSYKDQMQMQLFFEFGGYQLMPGVGFTYGESDREFSFTIDNNFKVKQIDQVSSFFGIGLRGD